MDFNSFGWIASAFSWSIMTVVAVASYRRCRILSRYPIWRSVLVAVAAAWFWMIWMVVWWVNRKRIATEWAQARAARTS